MKYYIIFSILFFHSFSAYSLYKQNSKTNQFEENIEFAKKTSIFIHKYNLILEYKIGSKFTKSLVNDFGKYKEESQLWVNEYLALKPQLTDEFKIADKSTGIIDHYSKRTLYSVVYQNIQSVKENENLKIEIERNILFYINRYESEFDKYSKLFPQFFIDNYDFINTYKTFENDLGFVINDELLSKITSITKQTESLTAYSKTSEFESYCKTKNSSLLNYEYYNTIDNSTPFKKYVFTKSTVHPTLLSWLKKESSLFSKNPENYSINSITPISEEFGRYRWGTWTSQDGSVIQNAYALKKDFIVSYIDKISGKCYAANFTAHYLESNNVIVSTDKIKLIHVRLINCK
ncbi:MAG: hypothetical protein M9916_04460 [Crocinitomicaceae bacterium]|nr:hypothetical protein [Crocinitomicaceae bacterium]